MPHMILDMYQGDGWIIELEDGSSCVVTDGETGNSAEPGQEFWTEDVQGTIESVTYVRGWFGHFTAPGYMDQTAWEYAETKEGLIEALRLVPVSELMLGGPGHDGYAYQADTYCVECGQEIIARLAEASTGDSDYILEDDCSEDTDTIPQPSSGH